MTDRAIKFVQKYLPEHIRQWHEWTGRELLRALWIDEMLDGG